VLASLPRVHPWVITNPKTERPFTTVAKVFERALERAGITTGDVTFHTLGHTALSRMIAEGMDDYTVMAISGHSSTRMLARYTHPTETRKLDALATFRLRPVTIRSQSAAALRDELADLRELLGKVGGRQEARTPDLRVAKPF
jgi:integrase